MVNITRRRLTISLLGAFVAADGLTWTAMAKNNADTIPDYDKWQLSNKEWKARLSPEAYAVLRKEATEQSRSSPLNHEKRDGLFACAGCGFDLFCPTKNITPAPDGRHSPIMFLVRLRPKPTIN